MRLNQAGRDDHGWAGLSVGGGAGGEELGWAGPGGVIETGQRGTAELLPEVDRTAERDKTAKVGHRANAAKVVGLAEESAASLMHETLQQALLHALRCPRVETAKTATRRATEQGIRQASYKSCRAQSGYKTVTVHHSDPSGVRVQKKVACYQLA